ncbi:MAG: hypothetical protein HOE48_18190 [Candidatus Latescibacteria bacterium]|nr:hypothetical protein [Candidatus Latescibacterota bacterium]MBT4139854.1 hypothetical protein [Candidatus Latescibacterota bacterium]
MTYHYQIYFRRRRGATGIPFELAQTEFKAIFSPFGLHIKHGHIPKHRIWVTLKLSPKEIPQHAQNLAYTEAILSQRIEPYSGKEINPIGRGGWYTGWIRQDDKQIYQEEVFVQDIQNRRSESPDQHAFPVYINNQLIHIQGHHVGRALSAMDTRYLFNIADLPPNARILDPFAGFGSIIREGHRRNITIFASDIDPILSLGLQGLAPQSYALADARSLPYKSQTFDAIITEPPFDAKRQQAIVEALPNLMCILKPKGKLVLLIAQNMLAPIQSQCTLHHLMLTQISIIPRDHGLRCPVLVIQSLTK